MNISGWKFGILVIALGTASLPGQEFKQTVPPPPPPPQILDAQTLTARRAVLLNRATLARAARAAQRTNEGAQGAPGLSKGSETGGQTSASTTPTVSSKAVVGLAPTVESSPAVGIRPSPTVAPAK
jgi:hypothetical protein